MASISSHPQFRNAQPPSKVIHLRNLPWECTEEELIELGKPFGKIVNTKCNVGANRNQAFIEFADLHQAIAMISYFASSAEPAQVHGKTVNVQYSNRQEIINNKTTADVPSNVLLATVEGVEAGPWQGIIFSCSLLHQGKRICVFSAFGFVHKIATFVKTAGFQALVQFSDSETASTAKNALDGRSIPRYLLQEHVGPYTLRITFSAHTDLTVKFQSHRSRDYTNPHLPVAPSAIDGSGQDGKKQEPESNVLLASVENMQYTVTLDVLHMVFSAFGAVQKIAIFEKNAGLQALIQYPDIQTARIAKVALEGHCIYEGGFCKLHLTYSHHTDLNVKINNDRGRDYTGGNTAMLSNQPSILGPQPTPMLGGTPSYNSVPYVPSNAIMEPNPAARWDAGAGTVSPLPVHMQNQMYMHHGAVPPGAGPRMMPLPGQGSQLGPPPLGTRRQVVPLPGQGIQQGAMPPGMSPEMMQLPGQGSQAMPPGRGIQMMQYPGQINQQFPMPFSQPFSR